jgi:tetratricopeptide (TPR) repeat protein
LVTRSLKGVVAAFAVMLVAAAAIIGWLQLRERRLARALSVVHAERAIARQEHDEAARLLADVLAEAPDDVEARFQRAELARHTGDYNTARNSYLMVLARDPRRAPARMHLFDLTYHAGARAEAEHHLEKLAALLGRDDPAVRSRRALVTGSAGR